MNLRPKWRCRFVLNGHHHNVGCTLSKVRFPAAGLSFIFLIECLGPFVSLGNKLYASRATFPFRNGGLISKSYRYLHNFLKSRTWQLGRTPYHFDCNASSQTFCSGHQYPLFPYHETLEGQFCNASSALCDHNEAKLHSRKFKTSYFLHSPQSVLPKQSRISQNCHG